MRRQCAAMRHACRLVPSDAFPPRMSVGSQLSRAILALCARRVEDMSEQCGREALQPRLRIPEESAGFPHGVDDGFLYRHSQRSIDNGQWILVPQLDERTGEVCVCQDVFGDRNAWPSSRRCWRIRA